MLETVREFGRMQLVDAGEDEDARAIQRSWAVAHARRHGARLPGSDQFAAIDALSAEEINLADELRGSIADGDVAGARSVARCARDVLGDPRGARAPARPDLGRRGRDTRLVSAAGAS